METTPTVSVSVTEEERTIIMSALDLTIKQGGLNVASKVLEVALKISEASKPENSE